MRALLLRSVAGLAILGAMSLLPPPVAAEPLPPSSSPAADGGGADPGFLRRLAETRGFSLGTPVGAVPTPDGRAVLFLRAEPRLPEQSLYEMDVASGQVHVVVTPADLLHGQSEQLSPAERARRERMRVTARGFTGFELSDDGKDVLLTLSGRLYVVARADKKVTPLPTGDHPILDPHLSPDGTRVAFVRDGDLHVLERATGKETRLTHAADPRVTNGVADFIAQEELSRFSGYWWSPDGSALAFEEVDSRGVEVFHIADVAHPEAEPQANPYPRPGKSNAVLRVGVVPVGGGKPRFVGWDGERFPYLASVVWKKGGPLTLVVLSRPQRDLEVLAADPVTGHTRRLLAEHDDAWIDLDQSTPRWLEDGTGFLWSSDRDGARKLELRDPKGALVRALPAGGAEHIVLLDVDDHARVAYVQATEEPTEAHLYRVPLDGAPGGSKAERLTRAPGLYLARFAKGHGAYVQIDATLRTMPRVTVHTLAPAGGTGVTAAGASAAGGVTVPSVAEAPPFVPGTELLRVGERDFRVALTRPRAFDPKKKYPVVVDVYGGPHVNNVTASMAPQLLRQFIADHGYIVLAADGRGTPHRGRTWARAIHKNFAGVTLDDQVAALRAVAAKHPEMDLSRVGIHGWSFGGYLSALAVMKRPDVFHVGVAGAPVVDWRDYDTAYTERYLDLPDADPKGYEDSSLLTYAAGLARPLLLIHGTGDDNVYFLHTIKLTDALFKAGRPFDLLALAGLTHMVPDPLVKERLYGRILDKLASVLKP